MVRLSRCACSILSLTVLAVSHNAAGETVHVQTPSTSLVLEANKGEELKFVYYGTRLGAEEIPW